MPNSTDSSLSAFIIEYLNYFASEARRLHDKTPLIEYKNLVDDLELVVKRLGTLEHEVALAALSKEYKHATREAGQAWREIWRDFFPQRRDAIQLERHDRESESHIRELEKSLAIMDHGDEELNELLLSAKRVLAAGKKASVPLSIGWRRVPWLMLRVNLHIYTVYLSYFWARITFFVMRHGFIVLFSVLIFGLLVSLLKDWIIVPIAWFTGISAGLVLLGWYFLKAYYVDPKIKRWRIKLEARWLSPIALHIFFVRALALASRTRSR